MQMHAQQGGSAAKASTSHFRGTTNIEEYIRDMASRGFSRWAVSRALGMHWRKFKELLEYLPEMEWVSPQQSWDCLRANQEKNGVKRTMTKGLEKAVAAMMAGRRETYPRYTAFGVTGTLPELAERFGVVSHRSILKRLARGMALEDALTSPRNDPIGGRRNGDSHPWRQAERSNYLRWSERQAKAMQEQKQ